MYDQFKSSTPTSTQNIGPQNFPCSPIQPIIPAHTDPAPPPPVEEEGILLRGGKIVPKYEAYAKAKQHNKAFKDLQKQNNAKSKKIFEKGVHTKSA